MTAVPALVEIPGICCPDNDLTKAARHMADVANKHCLEGMEVRMGFRIGVTAGGSAHAGLHVTLQHTKYSSMSGGLGLYSADANGVRSAVVVTKSQLDLRGWDDRCNFTNDLDEATADELFRDVSNCIVRASSKLRKAEAKAKRLELKVKTEKKKTKGAKGKRMLLRPRK
jgi:hypothetical protein